LITAFRPHRNWGLLTLSENSVGGRIFNKGACSLDPQATGLFIEDPPADQFLGQGWRALICAAMESSDEMMQLDGLTTKFGAHREVSGQRRFKRVHNGNS